MTHTHPIPKADERRRYKRLDHIFPVEFRFLAADGSPQGDWREAFTQDVSAGGLCLVVTQLNERDMGLFGDPQTVLSLNINIPSGSKPAQATAHPAWLRPLKEGLVNQYMVGMRYVRIEKRDNARILRYADMRKFLKAVAIVFTICLSLGLVTVGFYNARLRYQNEKLLGGLTDTLVRQRNLEKGKDLLELKIDEMEISPDTVEPRRIELLERALLVTNRDEKQKVEQLEASIDFFKKYQDKLKADLEGLVSHKTQVEMDVTAKAEEGRAIEKKVVDKFYRWLAVHQNNNTGLVAVRGRNGRCGLGLYLGQALATIFTCSTMPAGRGGSWISTRMPSRLTAAVLRTPIMPLPATWRNTSHMPGPTSGWESPSCSIPIISATSGICRSQKTSIAGWIPSATRRGD
jgi:hypothetical protein